MDIVTLSRAWFQPLSRECETIQSIAVAFALGPCGAAVHVMSGRGARKTTASS